MRIIAKNENFNYVQLVPVLNDTDKTPLLLRFFLLVYLTPGGIHLSIYWQYCMISDQKKGSEHF
jgi:hypothetical protein